jgi:hypothetical protein
MSPHYTAHAGAALKEALFCSGTPGRMDHGAGYPRSDGAGFEPGPQQEARFGPTGRAFDYPVLDQMAYLPRSVAPPRRGCPAQGGAELVDLEGLLNVAARLEAFRQGRPIVCRHEDDCHAPFDENVGQREDLLATQGDIEQGNMDGLTGDPRPQPSREAWVGTDYRGPLAIQVIRQFATRKGIVLHQQDTTADKLLARQLHCGIHRELIQTGAAKSIKTISVWVVRSSALFGCNIVGPLSRPSVL